MGCAHNNNSFEYYWSKHMTIHFLFSLVNNNYYLRTYTYSLIQFTLTRNDRLSKSVLNKKVKFFMISFAWIKQINAYLYNISNWYDIQNVIFYIQNTCMYMLVYQTKYDKHIMWLDLGHKCFEMLQWFSRFQRTFETQTKSYSKNWKKVYSQQ